MRLRLSFKLHDNEAELAHKISDMVGLPLDEIAKAAMQQYIRDFVAAEEKKGNAAMRKEQPRVPSEKAIKELKKGILKTYRQIFENV